VRLRTLVEVVAHLGASGQVGLLDAPESGAPPGGRSGGPESVRLGQGPRQHRLL
jgi:hypothetical protein